MESCPHCGAILDEWRGVRRCTACHAGRGARRAGPGSASAPGSVGGGRPAGDAELWRLPGGDLVASPSGAGDDGEGPGSPAVPAARAHEAYLFVTSQLGGSLLQVAGGLVLLVGLAALASRAWVAGTLLVGAGAATVAKAASMRARAPRLADAAPPRPAHPPPAALQGAAWACAAVAVTLAVTGTLLWASPQLVAWTGLATVPDGYPAVSGQRRVAEGMTLTVAGIAVGLLAGRLWRASRASRVMALVAACLCALAVPQLALRQDWPMLAFFLLASLPLPLLLTASVRRWFAASPSRS